MNIQIDWIVEYYTDMISNKRAKIRVTKIEHCEIPNPENKGTILTQNIICMKLFTIDRDEIIIRYDDFIQSYIRVTQENKS